MSDILQPTLHTLGALDHLSQFGTNHSLAVERLAKSFALRGPSTSKAEVSGRCSKRNSGIYAQKTFFDDFPLSSCRSATHHPSFVVEVTQNDEDSSTFWTQSILNGYFDVVECDESGTSSR
jgi:hypothetical protein